MGRWRRWGLSDHYWTEVQQCWGGFFKGVSPPKSNGPELTAVLLHLARLAALLGRLSRLEAPAENASSSLSSLV